MSGAGGQGPGLRGCGLRYRNTTQPFPPFGLSMSPFSGWALGCATKSPRSRRGHVAHGAAVVKAPPNMSPQPRRGDICPPQIQMMVAPSTAIHYWALALAAPSRLPTLRMSPLPGLRINRGASLTPRLRHGLQDAAAAAEGTSAGYGAPCGLCRLDPRCPTEDIGHAQPWRERVARADVFSSRRGTGEGVRRTSNSCWVQEGNEPR